MLDKITAKGTHKHIKDVEDGIATIEWDSFYWSGQEITVTTAHKVTKTYSRCSQSGQPETYDFDMHGHVTDISIELDYDSLLAAFDGEDENHNLSTEIFHQTLCDTSSSPEVTV